MQYANQSECAPSKKSTNNKCWRGCRKKGILHTIGKNVSWYRHHGEEYGGSFKKLKIELLYNLAIPLLGLYLEKMKTVMQKDACTPMFIAAIFYNSQDKKQPKCP